MRSKRVSALITVAGAVFAFGGLTTAVHAGANNYAVEVAPNGGLGGCQSSTGTMANVTVNTGATPMTIYCPNPNGFAWGRNLDTPDEITDAAVVDDGTDVLASWKQTGANNSRGRKLGLLMRVGDMSVKGAALEFTDGTDTTFDSTFDSLPNGKMSKRANLKLRIPRGADIQNGTVKCTTGSETPGITWATGASGKGNAYRAFTPTIAVNCGAGSAAGFKSAYVEMRPDATSQKLMTATASCDSGKQAVAGGYDTSLSTTSQWPMVVFNGPDGVDASGKATKWKVTVAVPSQNSSAARAAMSVWVTCQN